MNVSFGKKFQGRFNKYFTQIPTIEEINRIANESTAMHDSTSLRVLRISIEEKLHQFDALKENHFLRDNPTSACQRAKKSN